MSDKKEISTAEFSLETIISNAIRIPGVKVDRNGFLKKYFSDYPDKMNQILSEGPVEAGITREELQQIAKKLIFVRTSESAVASFAMGIPGGLAMTIAVPTDILQFFGMTLRLAQELSYLYGAQDLWNDNSVNDERIRNQLILYCGVMFGVSGAASGVRVLSAQLAKTTLKRIPQKALTKTFWYPLLKQIGKAIGIKVTKTTVAQGMSKVIPVVGGVMSGGLTFASMKPMADRLHKTLDKSCFDYSQEELEADYIEIESIQDDSEHEAAEEESAKVTMKAVFADSAKAANTAISGIKERIAKKIEAKQRDENERTMLSEDVFEKIRGLKELEEAGIISTEEFEQKKKDLLDRI